MTERQVDAIKSLYPNVNPGDKVLFIGVDTRETMAYIIAKYSAEKHNPTLKVLPLYTKALRQAGVFWRDTHIDPTTGNYFDATEGRPHSVDFSFTRFLVPAISKALGLTGNVLFTDCDFLFLSNIEHVFHELNESHPERPVSVVKHSFGTYTDVKMDGCPQKKYEKKLWTAMMFFNVSHPIYDTALTIEDVSTKEGMYFHQFKWLSDQSSIYGLPERYQYIPGHSNKNTADYPDIIHYTERAPWFSGEMRKTDFAEVWWDYVKDWKRSLTFTDKYERIWE